MSADSSVAFGNYLIRGIAEVELPEVVSWLPQTLGWKVFALIFLALTAYLLYRASKRWWHDRYRRAALKKLAALETAANSDYLPVIAALPHLLKAVALNAYPRADVAALSGDQWLAFLDAHYRGPRFHTAVGQRLLAVAYQPATAWQLDRAQAQQLIDMSRRWLRTHKNVSTAAVNA